MPGPPMGGGGPAAGTTVGDPITLEVTPIPSSGVPIGEELGVPPGVPAVGDPAVVVAAAAAGSVELSSERM
jgi:hypothetical protein